MSSIRIRPRIRQFSNLSEEVVLNKYQQLLDSAKFDLSGRIVEHHAFVKFKPENQHFWSPELTLEVVRNYLQDDAYADHQEPTLICGYVSPRPSLWTFFCFCIHWPRSLIPWFPRLWNLPNDAGPTHQYALVCTCVPTTLPGSFYCNTNRTTAG